MSEKMYETMYETILVLVLTKEKNVMIETQRFDTQEDADYWVLEYNRTHTATYATYSLL